MQDRYKGVGQYTAKNEVVMKFMEEESSEFVEGHAAREMGIGSNVAAINLDENGEQGS